ncbi:MAG: hypothetical protein NT106_07040 [Candidatus Sumerlaeota bacterium]|nr:hypothetical protein [Candidatus Sumerlaeota bacterium]
MSIRFTDHDIEVFIQEPKHLPSDYMGRLQLKEKKGHKERELDIEGINGNHFRLILRQANENPLDFSLILAIIPQGTNQLFRLRRYNGKSHQHSNPIEGGPPFYNFHIHQATERYQDLGAREDTFAEETDQSNDFNSTLKCLLRDCGFVFPQNPQLSLLDGLEQ